MRGAAKIFVQGGIIRGIVYKLYQVQVVGNKKVTSVTPKNTRMTGLEMPAWTDNESKHWRCDWLNTDEYTMNSAHMNNSSRISYVIVPCVLCGCHV